MVLLQNGMHPNGFASLNIFLNKFDKIIMNIIIAPLLIGTALSHLNVSLNLTTYTTNVSSFCHLDFKHFLYALNNIK